MKTKIQIKSIYEELLFEFEADNNSIKRTIEEAIKQKVDLRGANLSDANLRGADLSDANLSGADLKGAELRDADLSDANLSGADLSGAYLRGADLISADLSGANLISADLRGANLSGANLSGVKNKETAYVPIYNKWSFSIKGDFIQIGCKEKTIEEWDKWFNTEEEYSTKRGTEDFYRIQATYLALKSYKEHMDKFN